MLASVAVLGNGSGRLAISVDVMVVPLGAQMETECGAGRLLPAGVFGLMKCLVVPESARRVGGPSRAALCVE